MSSRGRPGTADRPASRIDSDSAGLAVQLRDVDARRDLTLALQAISLDFDPGTVTAVIGPNGAGKSTLFALISGRLRPSTGTVTTRGAVADVLQATALDPQLRLTVDDVVRMGRYHARGFVRPMRRSDRQACHEALDRVGLLDLRRRPINELSGGQRQRALLAQGIAQEAPVLLLDEPATGLDVPSQQRVRDVIRAEADAGCPGSARASGLLHRGVSQARIDCHAESARPTGTLAADEVRLLLRLG